MQRVNLNPCADHKCVEVTATHNVDQFYENLAKAVNPTGKTFFIATDKAFFYPKTADIFLISQWTYVVGTH